MAKNNVIEIFSRKPYWEPDPSISAAKEISGLIKDLLEAGVDVSEVLILLPDGLGLPSIMAFSEKMSDDDVTGRVLTLAKRIQEGG